LSQDEKRGSIAQQWLMADEQHMLLCMKTGEAEHELLHRAFRGESGDFLQLRFESQGLSDNFRRLTRANSAAREQRGTRDIQPCKALGYSPQARNSLRARPHLATGSDSWLTLCQGYTVQ